MCIHFLNRLSIHNVAKDLYLFHTFNGALSSNARWYSALVSVFADIAYLLKCRKDNIFKIRAYRKAARAIEELPVAVAELVAGDRLREIPGVGEAITRKLTELVTTGRLGYYERLKAEFPEKVNSAHG